MPQRKVKNGERPLPEGWSEAKDVDGKVYFIDHNARETSWIDPRDRFTKPMTFADCIGDELPFGWEEAQDVIVGPYYIDHNLRSNQIEDPRQQWKEEQEMMLREYLHHGKEDLIARQDILGIKGRRLWLAQEEVDTLTTTLQERQHGTSMGSKWSINSTTSFIDKYNCDDLKEEIDEAKQRVTKLKSEFQEVSDQVRFQRNGIQKLEEIDKKCLQFGPIQIEEARRIVGEMSNVHQQLEFGELERSNLLASLVELEGNFVFPDLPQSQSGSLCSLALSDSLSHTSQYDLAIDSTTGERKLHRRQLRTEYKLVLNRILELEAAIELVNYKIRASQFAPEQHLHMLMQERLTYLHELENYKTFVQTEEERMNLESEKQKLAEELLHSEELSCRVMDGQLQLQKEKSALKHELAVKTRLTSLLEQKLKDLSVSTLSMSSGSSHGSLSTASHGSLSASSRGSLTSLGISSNHIDASGYPNQNAYELWHQKNYSPIPPIYEAAILNTKSGGNGPFMSSQQPTTSATSLSSRDSLSASPLSSPPISPYPLPAGVGIGRYYPVQTKGQVSSAESTSNVELDRNPLSLSSLVSINPIDHDAYSSYRAFSLGSSISDAQGLAQCIDVSKSDESVAADSGVFEAATDCRSTHSTDHWNGERSKTAQLRIALEYDSQEGKLIVSIERGRNATDLDIHKETKQLYVKGSLLPVCTEYNFDFTTRKSTHLTKPVFNDQFLLKIHKSKVINKTLQLDVHCCVSSSRLDYNLGSLQISLAGFDSAKNAGFHWYNVLRRSSTTIPQQDISASNRAVSSLSLDCLRGCDESFFRPSSLLGAHFRGRSNSWSGDLHATLPERDEFGIKTDHEQRDLRSSFVEMSDLIPDGYRLERRSSGRRHLVSQVPSFYRDYIRSKARQNSQDGSDTSGSTNNLNEPLESLLHERSKSDESTSSILTSKSSNLNSANLARSSSDCTTNTRKFETWSSLARASFERRSLDRRRKAQITQQIDRNATGPTSIDLEMELQSAYMKQAQLDEEITRLKDIEVLMKQAKVDGKKILPEWVTNNTQFRKLLLQASNDITQRPPSSGMRTSNNKSLVRISKTDPKQAQIIGFKEKMAAMANPKISVPSNPEVHWV